MFTFIRQTRTKRLVDTKVLDLLFRLLINLQHKSWKIDIQHCILHFSSSAKLMRCVLYSLHEYGSHPQNLFASIFMHKIVECYSACKFKFWSPPFYLLWNDYTPNLPLNTIHSHTHTHPHTHTPLCSLTLYLMLWVSADDFSAEEHASHVKQN